MTQKDIIRRFCWDCVDLTELDLLWSSVVRRPQK